MICEVNAYSRIGPREEQIGLAIRAMRRDNARLCT